MRVAQPLALLLALVVAQGLHSSGLGQTGGAQPSIAAAGPLVRSMVWYDGDRQRMAWINQELIVEFGALTAEESAVKGFDATATPLPNGRAGIRFWKLNAAETALGTLRSTNQARYSPLFHDGASAGAPRRALPGNIIVTFKPEWTHALVQQWAAVRGLDIVQRLNIVGNVYVLKTSPGIAGLELANAIHLSGEVVSATPNWWIEMQLK